MRRKTDQLRRKTDQLRRKTDQLGPSSTKARPRGRPARLQRWRCSSTKARSARGKARAPALSTAASSRLHLEGPSATKARPRGRPARRAELVARAAIVAYSAGGAARRRPGPPEGRARPRGSTWWAERVGRAAIVAYSPAVLLVDGPTRAPTPAVRSSTKRRRPRAPASTSSSRLHLEGTQLERPERDEGPDPDAAGPWDPPGGPSGDRRLQARRCCSSTDRAECQR